MSGIARVGDVGVGVCYWHDEPQYYTTTFVSGAGTVMDNNLVSCVIGTIGHSTCGHNTIALSGSPDVFAENSAVHRIGDVGQNGGPYTVVSGSPDVLAN